MRVTAHEALHGTLRWALSSRVHVQSSSGRVAVGLIRPCVRSAFHWAWSTAAGQRDSVESQRGGPGGSRISGRGWAGVVGIGFQLLYPGNCGLQGWLNS